MVQHMPFDKPVRNRGRFDPRKALIGIVGTRRITKGEDVKRASRSRLSDWWRRGWIAYKDAQNKYREPTDTTAAEDKDIVSAEEGSRGWWTATYTDGSTKRVRRSVLEAVGYFDVEAEVETPVVDVEVVEVEDGGDEPDVVDEAIEPIDPPDTPAPKI